MYAIGGFESIFIVGFLSAAIESLLLSYPAALLSGRPEVALGEISRVKSAARLLLSKMDGFLELLAVSG